MRSVDSPHASLQQMNGQLSEHPLIELIREISHKKLSGKLQLQHDKVKVLIYFHVGQLVYAACNMRTFRLSEYLIKLNVLTAEDLVYLGRESKDLDLLNILVKEKRLTEVQAEQVQTRQISDVLRLALLWTDGQWQFNTRSQLSEETKVSLDLPNLLIEAARRLPVSFIKSRFRNPNETFSPLPNPPNINLSATEGFVLSRIDQPIKLFDLLTVIGLGQDETLPLVYTLAVGDAVGRENWKSGFRAVVAEPKVEVKPPPESAPPLPPPTQTPLDSIESFLERIAKAETHYEVLDIHSDASMSELKSAYYDIARKYHPDRYRSSAGTLLQRVESAFARVTQAYDTLREPNQRSTYNSKLDSKRRVAKLAQSAPKATSQTSVAQTDTKKEDEDLKAVDPLQEAEAQFKEGFAALQMGQRNVALGMLGSAAKTVPSEPRYRAYYGRALALQESTRRLAEAELQAAVKLDPKNAEYRVMLAELYRDLGFTIRAKGEAERALSVDANNGKARDLLKSLG